MRANLAVVLLLVAFGNSVLSAGWAGELIVKIKSGTNITVTSTLNSVGYGWDQAAQRITYLPSYADTLGPVWDSYHQLAWDCPKSQKNGFPYLPWGVITFVIKSGDAVKISFTIDFRDVNWATEEGSYPSHDTWLEIDVNNNAYRLTCPVQNRGLADGGAYTIWDLWNVNPNDAYLGTPVFLQNQYNGAEAGGTLGIDEQPPIPSGHYGIIPKTTSCVIATNNERFTTSNEAVKHQNWNDDPADSRLSRIVPVPEVVFSQRAKFKQLLPATISAITEGYSLSGTTLQFDDPWYLNSDGSQGNNFGPAIEAPLTQTNGMTGAYNQTTGGAFLEQRVSNGVYYSVRAPLSQTQSGPLAHFLGWSTANATLQQVGENPTGYDQKAVVFNAPNATVTALYKAHLATGAASLSDTKNQRRILWGKDHNGIKYWMAVYESMGDVWLTIYEDFGNIIVFETRLNSRQGYASNPTISNTVQGPQSYDCAVIGWLENSGSGMELHLQTVKFESDYWGWSFTNGNRAVSHLVVNNPLSGWNSDNPDASTRPALALVKNGSNMIVTYAYERSNNGDGLIAGQLQVAGDYQDLNIATRLSQKTVCADPSATLPAIAAMDASTTFIYYVFGGYSTLRLYEFNYGTSATNTVSLASGDATINSIQVAVNRIMQSRGLVVEAMNSGRYTVNYYRAGTPMYGFSPPSLATKYWDMYQPSVMIEEVSHYPGFSAVGIAMKANPSGMWYQTDGTSTLTSIGADIAGTFLREKVGSLDRVMMQVKSNTTPATIVRYPATGGGLQKSESVSVPIVETQATRLWLDKSGDAHTVAFKFGNLSHERALEYERGSSICAVKVPSFSGLDVVVSQVDSLVLPVAVDVLRNGLAQSSWQPSAWHQIRKEDLPGVKDGDILRFRLTGEVDSSWGYEEVTVVGTELRKQSGESGGNAADTTKSQLIPVVFSMGVFPNPLNPSTTITVELPTASNVSLRVFDMLGREVAVLIDGTKGAGTHTATFDGSHLASGVYFARLVVDPQNGKKPIVETRKLVMTK